ncbi:MAG: sporulation integral membrane protein YtvI [Lachnospiraceae bacterium]|nr:sporulation integral membrane protein YtvI [Lachnospiraceae bacterium]
MDLLKDEKIKSGLCFLLAAGAVYLAFRFLLPLVLPFVAAGLFAMLLYPVVRFLHRKFRLPIFLAGSLVLLVFLCLLMMVIFYLGQMLVTQMVSFFQNFETYERYLAEQVDGLCIGCDRLFRLEKGTVMGVLSEAMGVLMERIQTDILPALTAKTLKFAAGTAAILGTILIVIVSTLMVLKDMEEYRKDYRRLCESKYLGGLLGSLKGGGAAYLKTQLLLLAMITAVLSLGFFILRNPYALLLGVAIAVFDAFPVLGSGLILVPWALIRLFAGSYAQAIILFLMFLICQVLREFLEPKLLGGKLGIRPVTMMLAIYAGVKLFGVAGVFLGPIGLLFVRGIMEQM